MNETEELSDENAWLDFFFSYGSYGFVVTVVPLLIGIPAVAYGAVDRAYAGQKTSGRYGSRSFTC